MRRGVGSGVRVASHLYIFGRAGQRNVGLDNRGRLAQWFGVSMGELLGNC
jgi:hypothetical protein